LAAAQAEPAAPRSRRGLYMALGALVVVAVLIAAATEIPKFRRASAENAPVRSAVSPAPGAEQALPPAAPSAPVVASPPAKVGAPAGIPARKQQAQASSGVLQPPPLQTPPPVQSVQQTPPPAVQSVQPAPAAAPDNANSAELEKLKEQLNLLDIRAGACRTGIENLRRAQASSGLGLRADIAASAQRVDYYLNETESALQRKDVAAGKKNLDSAEREVSKLESFLGR
jgi:hypothetical protein